jgi:general secretion pathway protein I
LNKKTLAQWVAMNQLELARLQNLRSNQLPSDTLTGNEEMAGRRWYWQLEPVKTANAGFMQLRITVYEDAERSAQLVALTGVIDRFHRLEQAL